MHHSLNTRAFTLVELIVTATILVILTGVGFYSYTQNIVDTRDSVRSSDLADLTAKVKLYKQTRGAVPVPAESFDILNRSTIVAKQGKLSRDVALSTADSIQYDPFLDIPYTYSITTNRQEFEIAMSLENSDNPIALLSGTYKSVAKNVLPTLALALDGTTIPWGVEIHSSDPSWTTNRTKFIFHKWAHNLPYSFIGDKDPYSDGSDFNTLITDGTIEYFQNSDFRSCTEIYEAGKSISNGQVSWEYQTLNSTGALINVNCDFSTY